MGEAEELTPTDSLILAVGDTRNVPRLLAVIDSVEQRGELTLAKSIFFRTVAYNMLVNLNVSSIPMITTCVCCAT